MYSFKLQENVICDLGDLSSFVSSPAAIVSILDKQSHQSLALSKTSISDLREMSTSDQKGLLWILDEESLCLNSSDRSFLDRVKTVLSTDKGFYILLSLILAFCSYSE